MLRATVRLTVKHRNPIFASCRKLVELGFSETPIEFRRNGTLVFEVKPVAYWAQFSISEGENPPRRVQYVPFDASIVS